MSERIKDGTSIEAMVMEGDEEKEGKNSIETFSFQARINFMQHVISHPKDEFKQANIFSLIYRAMLLTFQNCPFNSILSIIKHKILRE